MLLCVKTNLVDYTELSNDVFYSSLAGSCLICIVSQQAHMTIISPNPETPFPYPSGKIPLPHLYHFPTNTEPTCDSGRITDTGIKISFFFSII